MEYLVALKLKHCKYLNYTIGYMGIALITNVVVTWSMYFYSPPVESGRTVFLSATAFGVIMALGRLMDAITDPLISIYSDNSRSKYGRRIPFIAVGALPTLIFFVLLWSPPIQEPSMLNLLYLSLMLGLFFLGLTVITCPYMALLPEIAKTAEERMQAAKGLALSHVAGLAVAMLGSSFLIGFLGFKYMAIGLGFIAMIALYIPVFTVKENFSEHDSSDEKYKFFKAMKLTLTNKAFIPYILSLPFFWFGFNLVLMGLPYIVRIQMGLPESRVGLALTLSLAMAMASFPLVTKFSLTIGKKKTFIVTMFFSGGILLLSPTIGMWPFVPVLMQGLIFILAAGLPLAGLFILPNVLLADITDYDESLTGSRREAVYYGMQGLVMKGTIGLSSLFLGFLLDTLGYSTANPLGVILIGPLAGAFILTGLLFFKSYPLR